MGENFDTNNYSDIKKALDAIEKNNNKGELDMNVSAVCQNETGEKYAFVTFSDGVREAEGSIPKCRIIRNQGFADIEIQQLEKYMRDNLRQLKKMAAGVDIFSAFLES
ncbi:hypothetical protein [Pseudobutyrivibrio xylanivorans]|uniref:Uncharacterized protein n=1 Tax=Pseudobutyrivibrio xylanivorans DSM 14809 TaxID=1123012 RepID=A0A1M6KKK7_PSEXY|nr:hypothetical protein [Pseudobutyrivibrio xylanivorans]SHJ59502.1 hypothetical protein SAMN02745725_02882 [Pseudobutyrivibrio xylanivorans DSM 14809]